MYTMVLPRHGQGTANAAGEFTGWVDVPSTDEGEPWRLNERQCGALTGRRKADVLAEADAEWFRSWRRSPHGVPPPLAPRALAALRSDPRFAALPADTVPAAESLADVVARAVPCRVDVLVPQPRAGGLPLVVAHGNSLRALITLRVAAAVAREGQGHERECGGARR